MRKKPKHGDRHGTWRVGVALSVIVVGALTCVAALIFATTHEGSSPTTTNSTATLPTDLKAAVLAMSLGHGPSRTMGIPVFADS